LSGDNTKIKDMNANLQGVLNNLTMAYKAFEHNNGKRMTKSEVKQICEYGLKKGYTDTNEITEEDERLALANSL